LNSEPNNEERTVMTTAKKSNKKSTHNPSIDIHTEKKAMSKTHTVDNNAVPRANPAARNLVFITPPPSANIPAPAPGFVPTVGNPYNGVRPRTAELVSLPDAISEIRNFSDWTLTLGKGAYPQAEVVEAFDAANQWSNMRSTTHQWDVYCRDQEGVVWTAIRSMMSTIGPAFRLAMQTDATLVTRFPKLASFLGVKSKSAKQSASTKAHNKKAQAKGEQPYHGAVGKRRKSKAEKAALAHQQEQQQQTPQPQQAESPPEEKPAVTNGAPSGASASNGTNGAASTHA
jgi:hypothetical protein